MSAAIPWVFVSAELNNVVHFDGNLSMSCPVHMYDDYIGRTIGIRFGKAKISEDVHTLKGMTVSLLKQLSNAVYVQNNDPRIINIYIRDIPVKNEFECMEQCRSLVNRGWMCVDRYLSANP